MLQVTKTTLKDIADRAQVSISSVSRALRAGRADISINDYTRERILQVAKELGYHKMDLPLQTDERQQETVRVGLVLHKVKDKYNDPYFSEIIFGIESELLELGGVLDFTLEVQDIFQSDMLTQLPKEGLAVICVGPINAAYVQELARHVPIVFSVAGLPLPGIDCVTVDFRKAAYNAVSHLIAQGHRWIGFIGGSSDVGASWREEERYLGYRQALIDHNLQEVADWTLDGGFTLARSYAAMQQMLQGERLPSAVFSASDLMAYGAYKAVQDKGLRIPDDLAVVAFDDLETSAFMNPALSTVRIPREAIGRTAARLLIQRMTGIFPLSMNVILPTELIVRNSSCRQ